MHHGNSMDEHTFLWLSPIRSQPIDEA